MREPTPAQAARIAAGYGGRTGLQRLARKVGIAPSTLRNLETGGGASDHRMERLGRLCQCCGDLWVHPPKYWRALAAIEKRESGVLLDQEFSNGNYPNGAGAIVALHSPAASDGLTPSRESVADVRSADSAHQSTRHRQTRTRQPVGRRQAPKRYHPPREPLLTVLEGGLQQGETDDNTERNSGQ